TNADTELISRIFGQDIHAGILVRATLEETRQTLDFARERRLALVEAGTSVVAELFAIPDLLPDPSIDPEKRRQRIEALLEEDELERLESVAGVESQLRRKQMLADGAEEDEFDDDFGDDEEAPVEAGAAGTADPEDGLSREDARLLLEM